MKKLYKVLLIFILMLNLVILISCDDKDKKQSGESTYINANLLSDKPFDTIQTFTFDGVEYSYRKVYNKDGNFIICDGGYIKTLDVLPGSNIKFYYNNQIKLYKCNNGINLIDKTIIDPIDISDGLINYSIAGNSNICIYNEVDDGNAINIGQLEVYGWKLEIN